MNKFISSKRMRKFILIWFGQFISLTGSGITSFALGVWIYQRTGSVTQFALISLFTTLPAILISPLAGMLIDRWDRRSCMILSDSGAGLSTLAIALLLFADKLQVWHIYLAIIVSSAFSTFQWPAFSAATTLLVPKEHLGRAGGMVQFAEAGSQIISPALAGLLVITIKIQGAILIDFATFAFSLVTLLLVRFPKPQRTTEGAAGQNSLWHELVYGLTYISQRPGLMSLLIFFAASNFLTGIVSVLVTPLVLAFTSVNVLGSILSFGGGGMLAGSIAMSLLGTGKHPIYGVFAFTLLSGLCILFAGLQPSVPVFFFTSFLYFFGLPIIDSCSQVIWQTKVAPDIQGRVFAVRRTIAWAALPLAYVIAGPLADKIFEPLLAVNGLLASSIGQVIGVGPGHGIALLFVVMGTLTVLFTIGGYLYPRLRLLEQELPDAIADSAAIDEKLEQNLANTD
jgi:MFS transporter, DHA3 family, macrolide efflux protein